MDLDRLEALEKEATKGKWTPLDGIDTFAVRQQYPNVNCTSSEGHHGAICVIKTGKESSMIYPPGDEVCELGIRMSPNDRDYILGMREAFPALLATARKWEKAKVAIDDYRSSLEREMTYDHWGERQVYIFELCLKWSAKLAALVKEGENA